MPRDTWREPKMFVITACEGEGKINKGCKPHLTIITQKDIVDPQGKFKLLQNFINSLKKDYSIEFGLYLNKPNDPHDRDIFINSLKKDYSIEFGLYLTKPNDPHDRDIITNYYKIHSGHSLDYYDKNGNVNKSTTLHFNGLLSIPNNPHHLMLREFRGTIRHAKLGFDHFGSSKNRLL